MEKKLLYVVFLTLIFLFSCGEENNDTPGGSLTYTLSIVVQGEGAANIAAGDHEYKSDSVVELSAQASAGWSFDHWVLPSGSLSGANSQPITMSGDKTVILVFVNDLDVQNSPYDSGTGTVFNPFEIDTAEKLYNVRDYLDKSFKIIADIDLTDYPTSSGWDPIGDALSPSGDIPYGFECFSGSLDGGNYSVSNLKIDLSNDKAYGVGLFSAITENAVVKNLNLVDAEVTGKVSVGSLVGFVISSYALIENCSLSVSGTDKSIQGESYVGGLVGRSLGVLSDCSVASGIRVVGDASSIAAYVGGLLGLCDSPNLLGDGGVVEDSSSAARVTGKSDVGGLIGACSSSSVLNSRTTSAIVVGETNVGGLVGWLNSVASVEDCFASGSVTASGTSARSPAGGLVGYNSQSSVTKSFSSATVTAAMQAGGLVGSNLGTISLSTATGGVSSSGDSAGGFVGENRGSIEDCYAVGNVSGQANGVGGLVGWSKGLETSHGSGLYFEISIKRCYSNGNVSGNGSLGGLIGENDDSSVVTNSYYDSDTSGMADIGKGEPKTTAQLKVSKTFVGWDFSKVWLIDSAYPNLRP
ncbi:MAG: hypothetical protein JXR63_12010 [Spirochaetales bacterium]|nr:hypothetical protein [Spirochaetales bacterium]